VSAQSTGGLVHSLIPRPSRCVATGESSPASGRWLLTFADQRLPAVAQTVCDLIAPDCSGLALAARLESQDDGVEGDVRHIRLALAGRGELPAAAGVLGVDPAGPSGGDESYRLTTDAAGITCIARTPRGLLRAAASAAQLLGSGPALAHVQVHDAPRYAWRGLMVDPARHFITPADLCRLVDLAALYKLNVLHLHLTDNQHGGSRCRAGRGSPPRARAGATAWQSSRTCRNTPRPGTSR
jgi:hexosaminidase